MKITMFALLAASAVLVATPAATETYRRQPGVAVEHYVFNLEVGDADGIASHEIKGETIVSVRFSTAGTDRVVLDLSSRAPDGTGMTVAKVSDRGGSDLRFVHQDNRLTILLDHPSRAGEARDLIVRYAGQAGDGLRFGTTRGGDRGIFSWNWPTHMRDWAPTVDHVSSKVTSEFVVTAPEAYSVVANGLLDSEIALGDGRKVTHWRQGVPITPWLNAVAIARFQMFDGGTHRGVPLQIWAPLGTKVDVDNGFLVARRTIDFFGDLVGPYPYEKLGQVMAPFDGSSTEHASVIFYGDAGTRDGGQPIRSRGNGVGLAGAGLLAHEIAHQWFGDSVTENSWGDVWLSEGFATYFADLYAENFEGRDAFTASLRSERTGALAAERRERIPVITTADEASGPHLTRVQYAKGGWMLHMLRQQVTTPVFFKAIKAYYGRYHGGHVTTPDLRRAMEEASGQDLGWFFNQWLTRVDSPKLRMTWRYDAGARAIRLSAAQSQDGEAYRLPIEIGIAAAPRGALRIEKIEMTGKTQQFSIPADRAPVDVVLDPNVNLLADMTLERSSAR
ncbi:M1 family metallopeptidase [Sphingomonas quercus]|uniref:M1 family metallopeptidase n=1 Tax=Sphingomonas quercus TaxID=2842451 RepID=A0ABS6BF87_9SPHN|nr:M1 family metallopeptidase [Sphingomonas quercus]MBU3076834.1 M1 family metallopeptidase [Sphingomonas quercus]